MSDGRFVDAATAQPARQLRPFVARYTGYRYQGFPAGVHLGLPSRHLTIVISMDDPLRLGMPGATAAVDYAAVASGLVNRAVTINHDGSQYGVQLDLTPLGARSLLHVPAGELAGTAVDLDQLIGLQAAELCDRIASAAGWADRFEILDEVLSRRLGRFRVPPPELEHAWRRITSVAAIRIGDLAAEVGWSRRHLSARFHREFGLTPKETARVARFERSRWLLQSAAGPTLARVAAACGYYDQAHLAREWNDLAGCPPSVWLATEEFPSVQDTAAAPAAC